MLSLSKRIVTKIHVYILTYYMPTHVVDTKAIKKYQAVEGFSDFFLSKSLIEEKSIIAGEGEIILISDN